MLVFCVPLFLYSLAVPAPLVIIEEIGTPFDGSEFTISCIVKVNKSVDTGINISTHWLLPMRQNDRKTMFIISERVTELVGHHNLTFRPLRSQDSGQYVCNATITPQKRDSYIAENTAENSYNLTVQGEKTGIHGKVTYPLSLPTELPLSDVSISINSTAGLGSEECLGLALGTASDSVVCEAGVVPNLINLPNISLWRDGAQLQSNLTLKLNYSTEQLVGEFHCRVCVNVLQSNIEDYCSTSTITTSDNS